MPKEAWILHMNTDKKRVLLFEHLHDISIYLQNMWYPEMDPSILPPLSFFSLESIISQSVYGDSFLLYQRSVSPEIHIKLEKAQFYE